MVSIDGRVISEAGRKEKRPLIRVHCNGFMISLYK